MHVLDSLMQGLKEKPELCSMFVSIPLVYRLFLDLICSVIVYFLFVGL